jgi:hypothetical protein
MKKITTQLSDEELLNLVDSPESYKRPYKSRYLAFISKYNISPGKHEVFTKALFELFKQDNPDISPEKFTRNLSKFLPTKRSDYTLFLINKNTLDIGKDIEEKLFAGRPVSARKVRNQRRHIEAFLEHFKLQPGIVSISLQVFIDIYSKWCYKYKRKKLNPREFRHLLSIYLPEVHIRKLRHFKVHKSLFEVVPQETINRIAKSAKKENKT